MSLGVVIGRFQVDALHAGHVALFDFVKERHKNVLILLGVRPGPATATNPLSFAIRERLVRGYCEKVDMHPMIVPIVDCPSDETWSKNVDAIVGSVLGLEPEAYLYCGRDGFQKHYHGRYSVIVPDVLSKHHHISSTERRFEIANQISSSFEFARGVIHAMENLPHRTYHTVDIAYYNKDSILLGRRAGETDWRLPGGFIEPREKFEEAARRELREETGMLVEGGMSYLGDFFIDDWRTRGMTGVNHKTVLFAAQHSFGVPKAGDDLAEVRWIKTESYPLYEKIAPAHEEILLEALKFIKPSNHICFLDTPTLLQDDHASTK